MAQDLRLYEQKILKNEDFPIQLSINRAERKCQVFPPHWHEHIELHYVLAGETRIRLDQKDYRIQQGDLLIINRNVLHAGFCDGKKMETMYIVFEMEMLSRELAEKNILFTPLVKKDSEIEAITRRLYEENEKQEIGWHLACKGILMQLIAYLGRNYAEEMLSDSASLRRMKKLERLNTVNDYIEKHYAEAITNKQLADLLHLSEDRFNHLFKESMGMPPLQYINEVRLNKAMHLLKKGEFTAAQVADAVGISDYNHFGRMFRRRFDCTPMEVRG